MALNGTAMLLKSIVGQEVFDQIETLATDGTFQKIIAFAENGEAIVATLTRMEQKLDAFIASFEEVPTEVEASARLNTALAPASESGTVSESGPGESAGETTGLDKPEPETDSGSGQPQSEQPSPGSDESLPDADGTAGQLGSGEPSSSHVDGDSGGTGPKDSILGRWGL